MAVHEGKLSAVLTDFARTLATDFPIQGILDHLVERIVEILPVTAAGVTVLSLGKAPQYISASDDSALRFEHLQIELGEGPCLLAHESGEPIAAADLSSDERFPRFGPAALESGLAAVFTFPLREGSGRLGALDLYRDTPGSLDPHDMEAAQTLADVAAAYLLNAQAREEAQVASEQFRYSALHDALTGLPNRMMLRQRLEHAALRARRSHTNSAILFADLDRFKQVNDTHGHQVGDELLLAVAHRLSGLVRPGDTLARFSGDEFVFLCEDLFSVADAEMLAVRIEQAFAAPFMLTDVEISITASVGTAYSGPGRDLSSQLLVDADIAMYQAKRQGGGRHQIFDLREAQRMTDNHSLGKDLRTALVQGQLEVAYQPMVRSVDGLVTGVEALLRWNHPRRGPISPPAMIAVAEQSGLISDIGAWVLERACRDRADWLKEGHAIPLDLAVNVSGRQLMSPDFRATVAAVLERTDTDPAGVVLELTENVLIEDGDRSVAVLGELKELGVRLALDDFGTGFSSLSYLRRLPIDIVKVDQGFVADIDQAPGVDAIIAAVTNLSHALGMTVTAEGVETPGQRDEIGAIGCDHSQGYFYARPMPAATFSMCLGMRPLGQLRLPTQRPRDPAMAYVSDAV
ncbi:MAG TPA: EAL domain-containing protein [Mycobacteriales bacterium]|nr:EAL domain-containing protein [Mycobacteriales bacterium]